MPSDPSRTEPWDLVLARVSEGHCGACSARLREVTHLERPLADQWYYDVFAVCSRCNGIHYREPHGEARVLGVAWHCEHPDDPLLVAHPSPPANEFDYDGFDADDYDGFERWVTGAGKWDASV